MAFVNGLRCRECGREYPSEPFNVCDFCFGPLEVVYDYATISEVISQDSIAKGGMLTAYGLRRANVGFWPVYVLIAGGLSWLGLFRSSIEPALALVIIVPFLPGPPARRGPQ